MFVCDSYWHRVLILSLLLLNIQLIKSAPFMTDDVIIISNHEQIENKSHFPLRESIETSAALLVNSNSNNPSNHHLFKNENADSLYDEFASLKKDESTKAKNDMLIENLNEDKAYVEYIVEATPLVKQPTDNKHNDASKKQQKILFKADKNLQRVEKKSWKIPMKTIAQYSEISQDNGAPQQMMDELSEIFNSFKDA